MEDNKQTQLSLDDHELLLRLASQQKAAAFQRRITVYIEILILILILAAILIIGPKLITLTADLTETLERVNTLLDEAQPAVSGISELDYESLNSAISSFKTSAEQFAAFTAKLSTLGGIFR